MGFSGLKLSGIFSLIIVFLSAEILCGQDLLYDAVPISTQASFDNIISRDNLKIAYLPPATEFNFYLDLWKGLSEASVDSGHEVFLLAPQKDDPAEQLEMLERVIDQDVSAIVLSTHDERSAAPLIEKAVSKGIVIIIVNTDVLEYSTAVHGIVGYVQRKGTYELGNYALSLSEGRQMKVGILEGEPGYHSSERIGGFEDALTGSKLKIVFRRNGRWNTVGGYFATLEMFEDDPGINMVFAANDFEIIGAEAALKIIGRDDVLLFGNDGVKSVIPHISEGHIAGTVFTDPRYMGKIAYQVVLDSVSGKFNGGFVETPTEIITIANVEYFMTELETEDEDLQIDKIRIVSDVRSGFTNLDGTGLFWDIFREVFEGAGIAVDFSIVPLKRAQMMIDNSYADVMLGHYRGESERMVFPQWHYGIHLIKAIYKKDLMAWTGLNSLEGKRLAWIRGAAYDKYLSVQVTGEERNNHLSPLLMLQNDRIDVFLEEHEELYKTIELEREILRKSGFDLAQYALETVLELELYPGFPDTPRGRALAKIYDDRFPVLLSSGKLKSLYEKWEALNFPFDSN